VVRRTGGPLQIRSSAFRLGAEGDHPPWTSAAGAQWGTSRGWSRTAKEEQSRHRTWHTLFTLSCLCHSFLVRSSVCTDENVTETIPILSTMAIHTGPCRMSHHPLASRFTRTTQTTQRLLGTFIQGDSGGVTATYEAHFWRHFEQKMSYKPGSYTQYLQSYVHNWKRTTVNCAWASLT
jgi:hypothetical protein